MELAGWLILALVLPAGLYLFLIAPGKKKRKTAPPWFQGYMAHRGLHGEDAPENSLKAFQRAAEQGYGVELDVRLTRDGCLAVHHDDALLRTCGMEGKISEMTLEELRACRLMGTEETIPTLEEVLAAVGGRIPLILELKTAGRRNGELAEKVYNLIRPINPSVCVESFDPRLMRWFRKNAPEVFRGQLACDPAKQNEKRDLKGAVGAYLLGNCLSRPDFVAYNHEGDRNLSLRLIRRLFHTPLAAWTVRSSDSSRILHERYDVQIFEGFHPDQE